MSFRGVPQPAPGAATAAFEAAFGAAGPREARRFVEDDAVRQMSAWESVFSGRGRAGAEAPMTRGDVFGAQPGPSGGYFGEAAAGGPMREFSEALGRLDLGGELPVLGHGVEVEAVAGGAGEEVNDWVRQFTAGGEDIGGADSYGDDLYDYAGAGAATTTAAVGYQFGDGLDFVSLSAREALLEGARLREVGELPRAVDALEEAAKRSRGPGEDAEAWFLLGTTHAECDDDERAILAFLRCVESAKTEGGSGSEFLSGALLALGVCYTNELDTPRAMGYLRDWLDLRGPGRDGTSGDMDTEPAGHVDGEHRDLLRRLERVSRLDADDVDVSIAMGVLYNLSREYELAAGAFRMAVALRPDDARLWNKLGATLANGNESDDALRAYRKAVDLSPTFIRAWVNVGTAYANRSNYDKAARYYLKALAMHADRTRSESSGGSSSTAPPPPATSARAGGLGMPIDSEMMHVWGYLRTTLVALEREDLLPLIERGSAEEFKNYIPF